MCCAIRYFVRWRFSGSSSTRIGSSGSARAIRIRIAGRTLQLPRPWRVQAQLSHRCRRPQPHSVPPLPRRPLRWRRQHPHRPVSLTATETGEQPPLDARQRTPVHVPTTRSALQPTFVPRTPPSRQLSPKVMQRPPELKLPERHRPINPHPRSPRPSRLLPQHEASANPRRHDTIRQTRRSDAMTP